MVFGACVYMKSINNSEVSVNLLCARSRVALLKTTTLPRHKLCAAVLLAELLNKVIISLKIKFSSIELFSDSTAVLA